MELKYFKNTKSVESFLSFFLDKYYIQNSNITMNQSEIIHVDTLWKKLVPMTHKEGIIWGLEHLQQTKRKLEDLEQQAIVDDDAELHNEVRASLIHAKVVEKELQTKLKETN